MTNLELNKIATHLVKLGKMYLYMYKTTSNDKYLKKANEIYKLRKILDEKGITYNLVA